MTITIQPDLDTIPHELTTRPQWVVWTIRADDKGKPAKVPFDAGTGRKASTTNPNTWSTFDQSVAAFQTQTQWEGIGYVFAADDPYTFVDLDNCRNPDTGKIATWAQQIVDDLDSYGELSQSGTGVHIYVMATKPGASCATPYETGKIEIYEKARFGTISGQRLAGTPATIEPRQTQLEALCKRVFVSQGAESTLAPATRTAPVYVADEMILNSARNAKNGVKFAALWAGDTSGHDDDDSSADLALCSLLTFWTGPDPARIERLFDQSKLAGREKWHSRPDYRERTISKALSGKSYPNDFYAWPDGVTFTSSNGVHPPADSAPSWPAAPAPAIYQGFAGEIVTALELDTEADPVALLLTLLAAVGNIAGSGPHWRIGGIPHALRINPVLVGPTSKGRKGTAWGALKPLLRQAAPEWIDRCTASGLSSGEGLIWSVRDPIYKTEPVKENKIIVDYQQVMIDPGVDDKRLFVTEQEFAATLKVMGRESNILSATIRQAWDDGDLRTLTKNSPAKATGAHISILGHITQDELLRYLSTTEAGNGFANRFLWACVRRARLLPDGGSMDANVLHALGDQLGLVIENSEHIGLIERNSAANELWHEVYGPLSDGGLGLMGAITSRAEAQVMRLAAIYAVLDESRLITSGHLYAALKLWEYVEASVEHIFGDRLGDPAADMVLSALKHGELTRTDISNLFGRNLSATRLDQALGLLLSAGKVKRESRDTGGRPAEVWIAV